MMPKNLVPFDWHGIRGEGLARGNSRSVGHLEYVCYLFGQPFTGCRGTGPFFGEKACFSDQWLAENMDLSPSRGSHARSNACFRSAIRSSLFSMPQAMRTMLSEMPTA